MEDTSVQQKFEKLPAVIREAITSVDFAEKLQNIGKANSLHLDELDALFEEVGFVMLGDTRTQDFGAKISERLSLRPDQVAPIVKSVDEEIFRPIRTALISLHDNEPRRITDVPLPAASAPSYVPPVPQKNSLPTTPESNLAPKPITVKEELSAPTIHPIYNDKSIETQIPSSPQTLGDGVVVTPEISALNEETPTRENLLNAIEGEKEMDPALLTPHRQLESQDPRTYLIDKEEFLKKITEPSSGSTPATLTPKKRSLAEEAVLVAKRKVDPTALNMQSIIAKTPKPTTESAPITTIPPVPATPPTITLDIPRTEEQASVQTPPEAIYTLPKEIAPTQPITLEAKQKLTSMVQVPRVTSRVSAPLTATSTVTTETTGSRVDPYREPI